MQMHAMDPLTGSPIDVEAIDSRSSNEAMVDEVLEECDKLQILSSNLVEGSFIAETPSIVDHAFSGILFGAEVKELLPIYYLEIQGVAIRGDLGRISVYSKTQLKNNAHARWQRNFGPEECLPSWDGLRELELTRPIRLQRGMKTALYIHSELPSDTAIVYANQRSDGKTYEDDMIAIHSGLAHTSNQPFSLYNHWGSMAWRRRREFVGRIKYAAKLVLWTPKSHMMFPKSFRHVVHTILLCANRRENQALGCLPKDVLFNIINFLPWDTAHHEPKIDQGAPERTHITSAHKRETPFKEILKQKISSFVLFICCAALLNYIFDLRQRFGLVKRAPS